MKFFLDHDVPRPIRHVLERHGFEVSEVSRIFSTETSDEAIFKHAAKEGYVMVTCNRADYLCLAQQIPHSGLIILIRRRRSTVECAKLLQLIRKAGESGIANNINFA